MFLKPQLHTPECAYICMLWPTYAGCYSRLWAEGLFGHLFPKIYFFLFKKLYFFHFNTPQVNLISDQALNQPWALEFRHHWGTKARVVKGTKCGVYTMLNSISIVPQGPCQCCEGFKVSVRFCLFYTPEQVQKIL